MTPEHIVERRIWNIMERPKMFVGSFSELEAVLYVLVGVLQNIRGDSSEDNPSLHTLSSKMFGAGCFVPSGKIVRMYGHNVWDSVNYEKCMDVYREWVAQFLSSEHQPIKTKERVEAIQDNVIMMRRLRSPDEEG